jgi:DNA-binding MurR/RpiR family transcriptional regulator
MILEQLQNAKNFSESEQTIIRYLLNAPETILDFSIKDLAKVSYTSPSTVIRLINKLNNKKGFSHFKATFFNEINSLAAHATPATAININETNYSIINKVANLEIETIEKTRLSINYTTIANVSKLLNSSTQIEFFGFDDNLHLVKTYLYRMMALGKQVSIHDSANAQYYQAIQSSSKAVAIVMSRTGENRRLVEIGSHLKERHTPIILLTPSHDSTLGQLATEWIEIQNDVHRESIGNIVYDTCCQYILNVLCGILYSNNYENNKNILHAYKKNVKHMLLK